jgi:hypothetical protein
VNTLMNPPIAVAAQSKARTVFARFKTGIVGSWVRIPLRHGCLCSVCVLYISELKLLIKKKLNMNSLKLAEWAL